MGRTIDVHGEYWIILTRYIDGIADPFFGAAGITSANFKQQGGGGSELPTDAVIDGNGNIVVTLRLSTVTESVAKGRIGVMRFEANGTLDGSFGTGGRVLTRT